MSEISAPASSPARDLTQFFCPRSIAVVGASRKEGSVGHALVRNLIYGGYTGVIYPVNPNAKGIQGIPCFPDLNALPDPRLRQMCLYTAAHLWWHIIATYLSRKGSRNAFDEQRQAHRIRPPRRNLIRNKVGCLAAQQTVHLADAAARNYQHRFFIHRIIPFLA